MNMLDINSLDVFKHVRFCALIDSILRVLPRDAHSAKRGIAMLCCPSVCPSVTFVNLLGAVTSPIYTVVHKNVPLLFLRQLWQM